MSDAYRQKLLNWFCSMLLALLVAALSASIVWFYKVPKSTAIYGHPDLTAIAGLIGESLMIYPIYFLPMAIWHFFDFIERQEPAPLSRHRLTRWRTFLSTLIATTVFWLGMAMELWQYNSCDNLDGAFYFQCLVGPSPWLFWPWLLGMGVALLLCIAKAVFSIRSQFQKAS